MRVRSIREFFERGLQDTVDRGGAGSSNRVELAAAVLMVEISLADASVGAEELAVIKATLTDHFAIPVQQVDELIDMARHEVDLAVSLREFTRMLNDNLDAAEKIHIIEALWKVAFADAVLDKYEEYYLRKIADLLYISHKDYLMAKHRVADSGH